MRKSEMFWWGVIAAVFASSAYGYNYHDKLTRGYCPSEGRFLGEDELLDIVISDVLDKHEERIAKTALSSEEVAKNPWVKYTDSEDFRQKNPNCCKIFFVTPDTVEMNPYYIRENTRVFGRKYYAARIGYLERLRTGGGGYMLIDVCGNLKPPARGGKKKILRRVNSHVAKR